MVTIMIAFHLSGFRTFKHFYTDYVAVHWREHFPKQVSYNRFVELQPRCAAAMVMFLNHRCKGRCSGISFIDSTSIKVCRNQRINSNKTFKNIAERGRTSMGWFFGFKLHLIANDRGDIVSFLLTKGNVSDNNTQMVSTLAEDLFGKLFGDKGYISKKLFGVLFNKGVHLVTKIRNNMKNVLMTMADKILLRKRAIIESINDELKNICQIEHSRHRSLHNFFMNIASALCAYNYLEKKPSLKVEYHNSRQLSMLA